MPVLPDIPAQDADATTTADMVAATRDMLAEPVPDFYTDLEIIEALNDGKDDIFSEINAIIRAYSGTVPAGQATVPAPADFGRWIDLRLASGAPLIYVTAEDYTALTAATGIPGQYCPTFLDSGGGYVLVVYPTPDVDYNLAGHYYALPPRLTDDQGPTWHKKWHMLPTYYAAARLLPRDNKDEEAALAQTRYEQGKAEYRRWLATREPNHDDAFAAVPKGTM